MDCPVCIELIFVLSLDEGCKFSRHCFDPDAFRRREWDFVILSPNLFVQRLISLVECWKIFLVRIPFDAIVILNYISFTSAVASNPGMFFINEA